MFDDLIRNLKNLESISIPIETDEKGYVDRQCPSEECEFLFKVNEEDWRAVFKDEAVWCPLCRHEEPAEEWFSKEQVERAKAEAFEMIEGQFQQDLRTGAQKFNRRQRGSFIQMSMKVTGPKKRTYAIPIPAAEAMQLEIQCEECQSRFAVIGSAYFCPGCGHNSVERTFNDSLRKIEAKKTNLNKVREALSDDKDQAELTCRSLLETCISDGVVAFQKLCDERYKSFEDISSYSFNVFQRLKNGSELWKTVISEGYEDWLTVPELNQLNILYQRRHLLAHNEGIVDERYLTKSNDSTYKEGQRIVVSEKDVEFLLHCLTRLSEGLGKAIEKQRP
jgi:hypothetical protein